MNIGLESTPQCMDYVMDVLAKHVVNHIYKWLSCKRKGDNYDCIRNDNMHCYFFYKDALRIMKRKAMVEVERVSVTACKNYIPCVGEMGLITSSVILYLK